MGGGAFQPVEDQLDHHPTGLDSSPLGIKLSLKFQKMNGWAVLIAAAAMPVYPVAVLMVAKRWVKAACIIEFV